jgi:hypothetical protein
MEQRKATFAFTCSSACRIHPGGWHVHLRKGSGKMGTTGAQLLLRDEPWIRTFEVWWEGRIFPKVPRFAGGGMKTDQGRAFAFFES